MTLVQLGGVTDDVFAIGNGSFPVRQADGCLLGAGFMRQVYLCALGQVSRLFFSTSGTFPTHPSHSHVYTYESDI